MLYNAKENVTESFINSDSLENFQIKQTKTQFKTTKKVRYKFMAYRIMVSCSKLCMLHFSMKILRPECVD